MKITIVTDAWHPQINGVVRTLEHTAHHLRLKGFDVSIIEPSMFCTIPCPTYPEIKLSLNIWKVGKMIRETKPDYLHISTEGPLGFAAKRWADKRSIPYTTAYHTRYPEYLLEHYGGGLSLGYKVIKWFHGRAKSVMVNTESMKQLLTSHAIANLSVWDRGVDADLFHPDGDTPQLFKRLPRPIVLNVGRVSVEKNLPAFYDLHLQGSKVQVGSGPMLATYKEEYPDVHFVGPKIGEELATYYRGADVFAFPSKSDTYGLVMLESLACGVPVAAFPVDGPKDVIIDGQTGILDDNLAAAIRKAFKLRHNDIRSWAMTKSWEACTEAFIANLVLISTD